MRISIAVLALAILGAGQAWAENPEEVSERFFDALRVQDYVLAAELFDADALLSFRKTMSFLSDLEPEQQSEVYTALFGPDATGESVEKLSNAEFFSTFLRMGMSQLGMENIFDSASIEYLGHVPEALDIAHIVARMTIDIDGAEFEKMTVVSCRKVGDQWKLLMSGEIRGLSTQLKTALGAE